MSEAPASGSPETGANKTPSRPMVVAIDGPSGVGKSTVARLLAERLGLPMLDTGATYRALALRVLESGVDLEDREAVLDVAGRAEVDLRRRADGAVEVLLDGLPIGRRIRTPEVSAVSSLISVHPEIRERMVEIQRRSAADLGAVVEGRDIGTVVFPRTPFKFFLSARPEVRAARRHRELTAAGGAPSLETVRRDIEERDARDSGRRSSPLVCDATYHSIDTSELTPEEIVERMVAVIRRERVVSRRLSPQVP